MPLYCPTGQSAHARHTEVSEVPEPSHEAVSKYSPAGHDFVHVSHVLVSDNEVPSQAPPSKYSPALHWLVQLVHWWHSLTTWMPLYCPTGQSAHARHTEVSEVPEPSHEAVSKYLPAGHDFVHVSHVVVSWIPFPLHATPDKNFPGPQCWVQSLQVTELLVPPHAVDIIWEPLEQEASQTVQTASLVAEPPFKYCLLGQVVVRGVQTPSDDPPHDVLRYLLDKQLNTMQLVHSRCVVAEGATDSHWFPTLHSIQSSQHSFPLFSQSTHTVSVGLDNCVLEQVTWLDPHVSLAWMVLGLATYTFPHGKQALGPAGPVYAGFGLHPFAWHLAVPDTEHSLASKMLQVSIHFVWVLCDDPHNA